MRLAIQTDEDVDNSWASPPSMRPTGTSLTIRPARIAAGLFCVAAGLATVNLACRFSGLAFEEGTYRGLREVLLRLDMDRENTVHSWFSSLLLFGCAGSLALIWRLRREQGGEFVGRWALLAAVFLYLSVDEAASLHEILIVPLRRRLGLGGVLYFAWALPGVVAVGGLAMAYLRFWWRLPRGVRSRVATAACMYVGGALGLELAGGALAEAYGLEAVSYTLVMTCEESLEMLGLIVFLSALWELIRREAGPVHLRLTA